MRRATGAGAVATLAAAIAFVAIWFSVLAGSRDLAGADILFGCCLPWGGSAASHPPRNTTVGDPVNQFLPWRTVEAEAAAAGQLPLWNPNALHGVPLLASGVAGVLSPFTVPFLPFDAGRGLSLGMLAKLWVAGLGAALFLRMLGARPAAAALAGIAYGSSGFIVVWLGWPQSSVAAIMPWAFAAAERHLRTGSLASAAGFAGAVAAQFLAGHAETSVHFGLALALYVVIRALAGGIGALRPLIVLTAAGLLGGVLAGIQLVPFVEEIGQSNLVSARGQAHPGLAHLSLTTAFSWVIPNAHGNPGIDGLAGRIPNYNETTGFAGVGALLLAPFSLLWGARRGWSPALGILAIGVLGAGTAYGPLSLAVGRLPLFDILPSGRFWVVCCFALAAAAGLGLDALLALETRAAGARAALLLGAGAVAVAGLCVGGGFLVHDWARVDALLPPIKGQIGFWVALAGLAAVAAAAFVGAALLGGPRRLTAAGMIALAIVEGALFAGPFNPQVPISEVPPSSAAIDWLGAHAAGSYVAATGVTMVPETATLYGLYDARGYEIAGLTPRLRTYWALADPGYSDATYRVDLEHPNAHWLAAAGVRYVMTGGDRLPGTDAVYEGEHVVISEVPQARPFAFVPAAVVSERDERGAADWLSDHDPLEPVVVEREGQPGSVSPQPPAEVTIENRDLQRTRLRVVATAPVTVIVLQSYWPGWSATVDGRATAIRPADLHFDAVDVPSGTHEVVLSYEPASVKWGAAATGFGLLVVAVLLVLALRAPARPRAGETVE